MRPSEDLLKTSPPPVLYHYTSLPAFMNIISERKIWATDIHYLNDTVEFTHAFYLVAEVLKVELPSTSFREVLLQLSKSLFSSKFYASAGLTTCITSFSEDGDLLSQWRAYCSKGVGVSIGFLPETFTNIIKSRNPVSGEIFARCIYDPANQREVLKDVLGAFIQASEERFTNAEEHLNSTATDLFSIAPLLKHAAFQEEREWRYIWPATTKTGPNAKRTIFKFRAGAQGLIPYVELEFSSPEEKLELGELVISPTFAPEPIIEAVRLFLDLHGVRCDRVRASIAPFRSWA